MSNDPSGKPPSTGLFVGCFIDVATGVVRYISHSSSQFVQLFIEPCHLAPASRARAKRSSSGSRWSRARSSSPVFSSRPPARTLCRLLSKFLEMVQILSNNSPILKCFILRISGKIIPATVNSCLNPFLTFSFPVRAWTNSDNSASLGSRHGQLRKTHCATVPSETQGKFLKDSFKGLYQKRSLCFFFVSFFQG